MTDDIVARLRMCADWGNDGREAYEEAADEIERLRETLEDIVTRLVIAFPAMEEFPPIQRARAALAREEKA